MTFFAGLRGTGSWGTDERPKNFREMILWAEPNGRAPFTALSAKMKTEKTTDPEFSWWEETLKPAVVYLNDATNMVAGDTVFVVDHGPGTHTNGHGVALVDTTLTALQFVVGDLLMLEVSADPNLNEIVRVASVDSATQFTAVRGVAGTTAAGLNDNTRIHRIGSHYGEGSTSPNTATSNPIKLFNYCQIEKTAFQVTNSAIETEARTGDPLKNDRKRKMFAHSEKLEWSSLFGRRNETTDAAGMPLRTTGGIRSFLSSNVTMFAVDPTEDTFINAVAPIFDWNADGAGNERVGFIGNRALMFLNRLIRDNNSVRINYDGTIKAYGMELMRFTLPMGTIAFKSHPMFNVHPQYSSSMLIFNPQSCIRRPLGGRDTKEQKNIQANDADLQKNQWIDEIGWEFHHEKTNCYIGGFRDWP